MGWGDKFNQITKSAVSKSKEMAEITRLNLEISNNEQKIRELASQIGLLVVDLELLTENEQIAGLAAQIQTLREIISKNRTTIQEIRNINICPGCGAEVSCTSRFCDKCGSPMDRSVLESPTAGAAPVCPACGAALEPGAMFCSDCGAKISN